MGLQRTATKSRRSSSQLETSSQQQQHRGFRSTGDRATTQKRVHYQLGRQAIYLVQHNSRLIPNEDWLINGGRIHLPGRGARPFVCRSGARVPSSAVLGRASLRLPGRGARPFVCRAGARVPSSARPWRTSLRLPGGGRATTSGWIWHGKDTRDAFF